MVALARPPEAPVDARPLRRAEPRRLIDRVPLPTLRAVKLFALAASPTLFAPISNVATAVALGLLGAAAIAFALDALRLGRVAVLGRREVNEPLVAFARNAISLELENPGQLAVRGRWLEILPDGDRRGTFSLSPRERIAIALEAMPPRGEIELHDIHLALQGPWGLAARHAAIPARAKVRSLPDLREPGDALPLLRARLEPGLARLRRLGEGRELDALRPYRLGDDPRAIDWKASAKRAELVSREYVPEKNQAVLLLVDCGRHFVAREEGRSRLDVSLEAALRLARRALERGDAVGLAAFASEVRVAVPPGKGRAQLRALVDACYRLQPELEESDYGAAFDWVARASTRRALVCAFTDVVDEDASRTLLARTAALRPRHLPLVFALKDGELARLERELPADEDAAYARAAAVRMLRAREAAIRTMRNAGATVVSATGARLASEAIEGYLRIKERGLL